MLLELIRQSLAGSVERASAGRYRKWSGTAEGAAFTADYLHSLAREGRIFYAHPGAAQNTTSLGAAAVSFVATTPDWTLEVPTGTTCIPLYVMQQQAGTVAGGAITWIMGYQNAAERSSAGTAFANITSSRSDKPVAQACVPYIAPTVASDTVGVAIARTILTQSVTTARTGGLATDIFFQFGVDAPFPYLVGPAALKSYSFAGTTAPSWFLSLCWAEIPTTDLTA